MNKEKLINAGIDYNQGVHRFGDKVELYEKYLLKLFETEYMDILETALKDKDFDGAFRAAHDLKGSTGNLSVNALYKKICELVEALREGRKDEGVFQLYEEAKQLYDLAHNATKE